MAVRACLAGAPMPRVRRVLLLGSISPRIDLALLVLRVWVGASLFLRHGLEKLFGSADAISQFPDPLHLGSHFSFIVATCSDAFFSILVVAGGKDGYVGRDGQAVGRSGGDGPPGAA